LVNLAILVLRLTIGGLMAGHGAQKLFGRFGGFGLQGTAGWLESLGLKPGNRWAVAAGASEFGGGVLTALGFLNPLGPLGILGSMSMATAKVHWGKPIWASSGGAELPVVYAAAATAVALAEPDAYSLDNALGIKLPRWVAPVALGVGAVTLALGLRQSPQAPEQQGEEEAGGQLISQEQTAHEA
jgi:putative oxidoreductase